MNCPGKKCFWPIGGPMLCVVALSTALVSAQGDYFDVFPVNEWFGGAGISICRRTAHVTEFACIQAARSDAMVALAAANNLSDPEERPEALHLAVVERNLAEGECREQRAARLELCEDLEEDRYDPQLVAANFVHPIQVPNQFFPLVPGTTMVYEGETEDGEERIEVTVTDETVEILGVTCTVVRDRAYLDDELIEDTVDYYAQAANGDVWYFGEHSLEIEDGQVVSLAGSWIAGEDGAQPGILMKGDPQVGDVYRQEFLLNEAEDAAAVLSLAEEVEVPFGAFQNCLRTEDFTPLEPDALENKFYAPGVGLVLEVDPESGDRIELVDVIEEGPVPSRRGRIRR